MNPAERNEKNDRPKRPDKKSDGKAIACPKTGTGSTLFIKYDVSLLGTHPPRPNRFQVKT